ncbi:Membrane-associated progesterone receptor component 2 [Armadillidium nasatum]|uniref:Membrane-associated progesterone receptor component 2 n=1 Tax=Armadillidium nasatum TaxID=96803 RepID=A0A5N5SX36_9CRUS|nr:Membrane-associated progesterone receptor component 2 [Armadillidium nasatum]
MAEDVTNDKSNTDIENEGFISSIITEIVTSPLNLFLLSICLILLYKIYKSSKVPPPVSTPQVPSIPKLKRQDMTLEQLRKYDGTDEIGRVCMGVNGKVFDVTRGKHFYGPGGPYSAFAGRDASRALATFSVNDVKDSYDDLSDLSSLQMDSVKEWEMQFLEKYDYIGKLLKPGEEPTEYSDDEEAKEKDKTAKKEE